MTAGRTSRKKPVWAGDSRKPRRARRVYRRNIFSMVTVIMCIFVVMLVIMINAMSLNRKIETLDTRIRELEEEIKKEEERAVKIEEFRKYTQTKGYVEEIAQQYFDFVYENEILFKQE